MNTAYDELIKLDALIKLATFTSGRRIYSLRKVRAIANQYGNTELVQRIDAALVDDRETRALDNRWGGSKGTPIYGPEVPSVDNWVDQVITSIRDGAAVYTKGAFAGTDRQTTAEQFLQAAFPVGVPALTSLPFVDQVAAVETLVEQLRGPLATQVAELGLSFLVVRLEELTLQYRELVDQGREQLTFDTVQAARKRGQRNLVEVAAMILGSYYSHTDRDHQTRRTALLSPIMEQDKAIRALLAARRSVADIDPDAPQPAEPAGEAPEPSATEDEVAAAG